MIYLDHALFSPMHERVENRVRQTLGQQWCSPEAPYARPCSSSITPIYEWVGASPEDHFIFTSSGAEAINQVIWGVYADVARQMGKNHFICSQLDEAPIILSMTRLEALGCHFQMIPASREGFVTAKDFCETLSPRTALLSLSWAGGLTGVIQPIQELAALCKERGVLLHVDATHVLGKGYFPFHESGADFLTFDGPSLGAPSGTGGLFIRQGVELSPLIFGGQQQDGLRGGSLSFPLLEGLIETARIWIERGDEFCMQCAMLRGQLEAGLVDISDNLFGAYARVPHISLLSFKRGVSEAICYLLAQRKVFVNMGGKQFQQLAHILKHCHIPFPANQGAVSFALGFQTTSEQVAIAIKQIREVVSLLHNLSEGIL